MSKSVCNPPSSLSEMSTSTSEVQVSGKDCSDSIQEILVSEHQSSASRPERSLSQQKYPKSLLDADSHRCLEKWLQYESAVLPDENLRKECEATTYSLCLRAMQSGNAVPLETIACALHCLLSGGFLPDDYPRILSSIMSEWKKAGIRPKYSEGVPTPSSLLELYNTVGSAIVQIGHPVAKEFAVIM